MSVDTKKTPYFLIDDQKVEDNYQRLKQAMGHFDRDDIVAYSIKANYSPYIINKLQELGSFFEVCSEYEYDLLTQRYGINPERIIINGCFFNKYSKYNDSIMILDCYSQLLEWKRQGCKAKIGIRINLDSFTQDDRFKTRTSRFGIQLDAPEIRAFFNNTESDNIICLHCHLSGNSREPSIYKDIILKMTEICDNYNFNKIEYFDIGGGYKIGENSGQWSFFDYYECISKACPSKIKLILEPGNSLVRNCCEYHTKIVTIKKHDAHNIIVVDGSSLHLPKLGDTPEYYINHNNDEDTNTFRPGDVVCGNTCKESDVLMTLKKPLSLNIGDEFVFQNVGAYSLNELNTLILGMPNIYLKKTSGW